jgi:methylated-DNA-[protein]-cysteine S-methyltransferase
MTVYFYDTTIGKIGIAENNGKITNVFFKKDDIPKNAQISETPLLKEAADQLAKNLAGELKSFDLPLDAVGTPFMRQVWQCLTEIPYGETSSYRDIAEKIDNEKAYRAVGLANNKNPIPIFIPCHRVIGTDGALTGYRGGLAVKKMLLELEKAE